MSRDDDEVLTALGAGTIPALPLASKHYKFWTTTGNSWAEVNPPNDDTSWHLVTMVASFARRMEWKHDPNLQQAIEKHSYEPEMVFLWAKRKS